MSSKLVLIQNMTKLQQKNESVAKIYINKEKYVYS